MFKFSQLARFSPETPVWMIILFVNIFPNVIGFKAIVRLTTIFITDELHDFIYVWHEFWITVDNDTLWNVFTPKVVMSFIFDKRATNSSYSRCINSDLGQRVVYSRHNDMWVRLWMENITTTGRLPHSPIRNRTRKYNCVA